VNSRARSRSASLNSLAARRAATSVVLAMAEGGSRARRSDPGLEWRAK
jgi:hypothetical protein